MPTSGVALAGTVRGINEDGPNRQKLDGYFLFDMESNHLSYLYLKGAHVLLDKDGKEQGRTGAGAAPRPGSAAAAAKSKNSSCGLLGEC